MELFDFWAFQNFMKMLSHDKIIFHMLFWAFHITPRIEFKVLRRVFQNFGALNFDT